MKVIKQSAHIVTDWSKMNLYERCEFAGRISHASEDKIKEGSAEEFVRRMVSLGHESVFEFARIFTGNGGYDPGEELEICLNLNMRQMRGLARDYEHLSTRTQHLIRCVVFKYPAFFSNFSNDSPIWNFWGASAYWNEEGESRYKESETYRDVYEKEKKREWIPVFITTNRAISHQLVRYRKDVVYLQQSQRYVKFHDDVDFIDPSIYFLNRSEEPWDSPEYEGGRFIKNHAMEVWKTAMEGAEQDYIWFLSEGYPAQAARLVLPNSTATKLIMYASPDTWRHVFEQRISDKADPMIRELLEPLKEEFVKEGLL